MKYERAFDISNMPQYLRKHIQAGQWVYLFGGKSRYMGQSKNGIEYVLHGTKKGSDPYLACAYRCLATGKAMKEKQFSKLMETNGLINKDSWVKRQMKLAL